MDLTPSFNIVIDSMFLKRDRTFSKSDMLYLGELSKLNLIKLQFPWFIYKECITDTSKSIEESINYAISSIKNLDKLFYKTEYGEFEKLITSLELKKNRSQIMLKMYGENF